MLDSLTSRLLWDRNLSLRWQRIWAVLILLAPIALAAGVYLQWTAQRKIPVRVTLDRSAAREIARKYLDDRGIHVTAWDDNIRPSINAAVYRYLIRQRQAGESLMSSLGLWSTIEVQFSEPQADQKARVILSPSGTVLGYRLTSVDSVEAPEAVPAVEAGALIRKTLDERLKPYPFLRLTSTESTTEADASRGSNRWKLTVDGMPDLTLEVIAGIRGRQVVESTITAELSDDAVRRVREPSNSAAKGIFLIYAVLLCGYLLVRYFKRRYQGEVSRQRMLLVTALVACFVAGLVLLGDVPLQITEGVDVPIPGWVPIFLVGIAAYLAGQVAGLAYAAAEGDLRETRPRLLTSLDALLSGRLFSRNVGRSVVLGMVLLSWMTLAESAIYFFAQPEFPSLGIITGPYSILFSRTPWLSLLLAAASTAVFVCLLGVMTPFSILERRWKGRRWIYLLLVVFALLTIDSLVKPPLFGVAGWLIRVVYLGALLASFFRVDLLATIVTMAGHSFVEAAIDLSQLSAGWSEHNRWVLPVAGLVVMAQLAAAFWGRLVEESEVRPAYATEIHERLQLESEVEAAKEAQLRLLPSGPPDLPGLTVSASCRATEKVSGDFYDFFPITRTRMGILVCDGGGNGLATALTIALAKGFLMHKAQADAGPLETLRGLEMTLGDQLKGISAEGICYLVLDVEQGTLRYARYGGTPSLLLAGGGDLAHEVQHAGGGEPLWEGSASLSGASRLIVYTNGLSKLVGEGDRTATNRWLLKRIGGLLWQPAGQLHDAILKVIFARRGGLGTRKASDDVTVIVCSIDREAARSMEQVA